MAHSLHEPPLPPPLHFVLARSPSPLTSRRIQSPRSEERSRSMEGKMKTPYVTKWTRSGCSTFFPELPDHWYDCEVPVSIPKDTARKKKNQTYRAHAPTRRVLFVFSKKVKVNAQGSASKNQKVKVKAPKSPVVNGVAHGLAESTRESKDYFMERLLGKLSIKEEKSVV